MNKKCSATVNSELAPVCPRFRDCSRLRGDADSVRDWVVSANSYSLTDFGETFAHA